MTIKLLIVDDSALMRRQLTQLFEAEGDFSIRCARNGKEAIDENISFKPDVMTLDINMPEMDGLTALSFIMASRELPVVMVSSLTEKSALATFEALALGAVDYIAKPGGTISLSIDEIKIELVNKVRAAARAKIRVRTATSNASNNLVAKLKEEQAREKLERQKQRNFGNDSIVIVGVSTGGPGTLDIILSKLSPSFKIPIIIAQHMPSSFTGPFANRMNSMYPFDVVEVNKPMEIQSGTIYVGRGGTDVVVTVRAGKKVVLPKPESSAHLWHPSVSILGESVLANYKPNNIIAVMLTGMGYDGADSFTEIKKRGGRTIAESEATAVVYGMPKELVDKGGASLVLPVEKIATQLESWAK